jgi:predicted RND superfamily exporter protein
MAELTTTRDPLGPERDPASPPGGRSALAGLGRLVVARARLVLVGATLTVLCFGIAGAGAFGKLKAGGFEDPGAESTTAQKLLDQRLGGASSVVLLVHAKKGTVDDPPAHREAVDATRRLMAIGGVSNVTSYWSTRNPQLRSTDGRYALILGSTNSSHDLTTDQMSSLHSDSAAVDVSVGGDGAVNNDIISQVLSSLRSSEVVAVPILLALLMLVFGSAVAAGLPLAIGLISILGTFAELYVLGSVTDVSIFAVNMTTALGMALGIDYALLMVSRFREEVAAGHEPQQAAVNSVRSAGRTIVFSGATVVAALAVLLIFPLYFLRSFAYAGIGVVLRDLRRRGVEAKRAARVAEATPGPDRLTGRLRGEGVGARPARQPHVVHGEHARDRSLLQHHLRDQHAPRRRRGSSPRQVARVRVVPPQEWLVERGHPVMVGRSSGGREPSAAVWQPVHTLSPD